MLKTTEVSRHVVGEVEERGAITFTCVREHRKRFLVEGLSVVCHGEPWAREEHCSIGGWWCGACGMPDGWRTPNRLLTLPTGDTMQEQVVFPAYGAPYGECDHLLCAFKLITSLSCGSVLN